MGTVQAFGDMRPGNSPAIVSFGGDLKMGANTATYIELGGWFAGEFDQMLIAGDLDLNGMLNVSLIDGFQLANSLEFLFADVRGLQTGTFAGLTEGSVVGNFGGRNLYITYGAGNGNDVALFTAVPEPGSMLALSFLMTVFFARRRRNVQGCRTSISLELRSY